MYILMVYASRVAKMATWWNEEKRANLAEKKVHALFISHNTQIHKFTQYTTIQRGNEILFLRFLSVIADQIQFNLHNFTM